MAILTYDPAGRLVQTGRNLTAIRSNAKKRGVKEIMIVPSGEAHQECISTVTYCDGFYSTVEWGTYSLCVTFFAKRWPGRIVP